MYLHPHIIIKRCYLKGCTVGFARAGDNLEFRFRTLELRDLGNKPNISCIPEGEYWVGRYFSPSKKTEVFQLENVPGRTYIQIHVGNFCNQIHGCILPGTHFKDLDGDEIEDVVNSEETMEHLLKILPERFLIRIESDRTKENE